MNVPSPTAAELAILRVLWRRRNATVRDIHAEIYGDHGAGYTGALKLMQNMLAKGLVTRVVEAGRHVYAPAVPKRATLNEVVRGWIDGSFGGSSLALAMQALDARPIDADELSQLRELVERMGKDTDRT